MLQILRMPLFQLPQLISQLVNAQVAIQRLREFLAADEQHIMAENPPSGPGRSCCAFLLVSFFGFRLQLSNTPWLKNPLGTWYVLLCYLFL